jgi:uncharacterized protein YcfL
LKEIFMLYRTLLACATCLALSAQAQTQDPGTPSAVAAKVALRGESQGVRVSEIRITRPNDILVVQADLANAERGDRTVFYRFRWLDSVGNQVGDGESWKQLGVMGMGQQTVKSVAPTGAATDFRLEMNVNK